MNNKIIALVDGSIYSESVCHHAAWIAKRTDAPVELIHVLGARTKLMEELAELDAQRAKLVSHRGRAVLEDARAIVDQDGVTEITTRLRHGDIVETITEIEENARVILIGKRGEAADFAKGHLGSNLERIVRAAHGLEDAKALLKAAGIEADTRVIEGQPETELGTLVEEESFSMVVMGAYGHSRIRSLVIGSTTTEMVRSCKVPVVLMR